MLCKSTSTELKALIDGELNRFQSWRVQRHIADCESCASDFNALKKLNGALIAADLTDSVQSSSLVRSPIKTAKPKMKLVIASMTAVALIAVIVVGQFGKHPAKSESEAIAGALATVNTWHWHGWILQNGKKLPCEIWGRKDPPFLYKRVGDSVTTNDGKIKKRIYPPDTSFYRPKGLVILTADGDVLKTFFESYNGPSTESVVPDGDGLEIMGVFQQSPFYHTWKSDKYRVQWAESSQLGVNSNRIFTVNRSTKLPVKYQLHFDFGRQQWDTEYLEADYNPVIPDSVLNPVVPNNFQTIDLTNPANNNVNVDAKVIAVDKGGDIVVRYKTTMAGNPVTPKSIIQVAPTSAADESKIYGVRNGVKTPYIHGVNATSPYPFPDGSVYEVFAPKDPLFDAKAIPQQFVLPVDVTASITIPECDVISPARPKQGITKSSYLYTQSDGLFTKTLTLSVQIPKKPNCTDITTAIPKEGRGLFDGQSLELNIAKERATYYWMSAKMGWGLDVYNKYPLFPIDLRPSPTSKLKRNLTIEEAQHLWDVKHGSEVTMEKHYSCIKADYWQQKVIELYQLAGERDQVANSMFTFACWAHQTGQESLMIRKLKETIAYTKPLKNSQMVYLQAKYALKTHEFPMDASYKGPTG